MRRRDRDRLAQERERADGVVGFVGLDRGDADAIRAATNERLPPYMQPREIRFVREWPLNANGKVDRKVLASWLEQGKSA